MGLPGYLYIFRSFARLDSMPPDTFLCKVGRSIDSRERKKQVSVNMPFRLHQWHTIKCADAVEAERRLHQMLADNRLESGEWFALRQEQLDALKRVYAYPDVATVEAAFLDHADALYERKVRRNKERARRKQSRRQQR